MSHAAPLRSPLTAPTAAATALLALLLVGCGGDGGRGSVDGAWRGVLPCVDCAGLEVELSLRRASGEPGRYTLLERYLGGAYSGEFPSQGEWREDDCTLGDEPGTCIVLLDAAQRWFHHEDASLQAIDAEGRPLDPDGARLTRL